MSKVKKNHFANLLLSSSLNSFFKLFVKKNTSYIKFLKNFHGFCYFWGIPHISTCSYICRYECLRAKRHFVSKIVNIPTLFTHTYDNRSFSFDTFFVPWVTLVCGGAFTLVCGWAYVSSDKVHLKAMCMSKLILFKLFYIRALHVNKSLDIIHQHQRSITFPPKHLRTLQR